MEEGLVAVMIVAIVFAFVSFSTYLRYRSKQLQYGMNSLQEKVQQERQAEQQENEALRAKTAQLEERVQVLESIVTGRDFSLKEEIDSLR